VSNTVYIATSLDGYIADVNGSVDWLYAVPNPEGSDYGFAEFSAGIDALLMGRVTYETVLGFDVPWPYDKPVFVLSTTLEAVPEELLGKVEIVSGPVAEVVGRLHTRGFQRLYVDGGRVIQSLLAEDLIDELILTRIPVLLGGGSPLFDLLPEPQWFEHVETRVHGGQLVQSRYLKKS